MIDEKRDIFKWDVLEHNGLKLGLVVMDVPNSKVNKLNYEVMDAFEKIIQICRDTQGLDAILLASGKMHQFIAGADITMLQAAHTKEELLDISQRGYDLSNAWQDLAVPTVVVVDGPALGGGLELCLASSVLLATKHPKTKLGFPEVLLGLIPGMGGCIRLPRKIGLMSATKLLLSGKSVSSKEAFKLGIVDALLESENYLESAKAWVAKNIKRLAAKQSVRPELMLPMSEKALMFLPIKKGFIGIIKKRTCKITKGHYPAPFVLLNVLEATYGGVGSAWQSQARAKRLAVEQQAFLECALSTVAKNLIKVFFLNEKSKKNLFSSDLEKSIWNKDTTHCVVMGAGVMGAGIATVLAQKGMPVAFKDLSLEALQKGMNTVFQYFVKIKKKLRWNDRVLAAYLNKITPTFSWEGVVGSDFIVEAVVEDLQVKQNMFHDLESYVSETCIIASNTSSLSISHMQSVLKHPARFVGLHFFNPVPKMPLVEIIAGSQTDPAVLGKMVDIVQKIDKIPLLVKDSPGFLVNRLLFPYLNEAALLLQEGISIERIDRIMVDFGMPMGPFELMDEVGVDVGAKVGNILYQAFGDRIVLSDIPQKLLHVKRLGKKSSQGFYSYVEVKNRSLKKKKKVYDASVEGILHWKDSNNSLSDQDILDRCVAIMICEAVRVIEEKIIESVEDIDLAMIFGVGFPPYRGGLMAYADHEGLEHFVKKLMAMSTRFGKRFESTPFLTRSAEQKKRFMDLMTLT